MSVKIRPGLLGPFHTCLLIAAALLASAPAPTRAQDDQASLADRMLYAQSALASWHIESFRAMLRTPGHEPGNTAPMGFQLGNLMGKISALEKSLEIANGQGAYEDILELLRSYEFDMVGFMAVDRLDDETIAAFLEVLSRTESQLTLVRERIRPPQDQR